MLERPSAFSITGSAPEVVRRIGRRLRIAFDAHMVGERETGNETYALSLLAALGKSDPDDEYLVLATRPAHVRTVLKPPSNFSLVRLWPGSSLVRIPFVMPVVLMATRADLLHVTYIAPPLTPCPTVVTVHDLSYLVFDDVVSPRTRSILRTLVPRSVARASRVIAISEWTKRDLIRHYDVAPEKIAVTHLAPDPVFTPIEDAAREALPEGVVEPFVLAVGNLEPRKNLARLVEAFAGLVRDHGFAGRLVLVGKPAADTAAITAAVDRWGLQSRVVFTGYVTQAMLRLLYNRAIVFAYPSLYEGFGLPAVEAMACNCPVVASNASALPEILGDAALLVEPHSTSELVRAMAAVIDDPELARSLKAKGRRQAALYSWDKTATQTRAVYEDVVKR